MTDRENGDEKRTVLFQLRTYWKIEEEPLFIPSYDEQNKLLLYTFSTSKKLYF